MSGLEAMALGLPVIGSDVSGINELISHEQNGLLTTFDQPGEVASATTRLYNDASLWRRIVLGGISTVGARSLDKIAALHLDWYSSYEIE